MYLWRKKTVLKWKKKLYALKALHRVFDEKERWSSHKLENVEETRPAIIRTERIKEKDIDNNNNYNQTNRKVEVGREKKIISASNRTVETCYWQVETWAHNELLFLSFPVEMRVSSCIGVLCVSRSVQSPCQMHNTHTHTT